MVNRSIVLIIFLVLTLLLAGIYGMLHDQISYSISPEYYTRFKFHQFGLVEQDEMAPPEAHRFLAAIVGFQATWWMGIPIGLILGLFNLFISSNAKQQFVVSMQSLLIVVSVALLTGLIGLGYGFIEEQGENWWLPDGLVDKRNFIAVGSMHNFSYLGGIIGIGAGILFSSYRIRLARKRSNSMN